MKMVRLIILMQINILVNFMKEKNKAKVSIYMLMEIFILAHGKMIHRMVLEQ